MALEKGGMYFPFVFEKLGKDIANLAILMFTHLDIFYREFELSRIIIKVSHRNM